MYLRSLTLKNVRQFNERTIKFQPGFNLLVGENGAGKTTILRGLLAAIGGTRQIGRRARLDVDDIRLGKTDAEINAEIFQSDESIGAYRFSKTLWEPEERTTPRGKQPLVLLYSSNEAICSAMKTKAGRSIPSLNGTSLSSSESRRRSEVIRRSEEFLYESEMYPAYPNSAAKKGRFGNSQSVRSFVSRVLSTFSPNMSQFYWRFEPYDCTLIPDVNVEVMRPIEPYVRIESRHMAMRWFYELGRRRKRRPDWPDQAKVTLTPYPSKSGYGLPELEEIWSAFKLSDKDRKALLSYSLEVKLTPRIMVRRRIGTLGLDQLSDGEQRLFSLFVDIARQLSINSPGEEFGNGEAIVLIDEIDVHLHPKWQRLIVPALEELFPSCQFIATTHSPFVIQATDRRKIIPIDPSSSDIDLAGGNSIDDIAEDIQGISVPQRSHRAEALSDAAKEYFGLLEKRKKNKKAVSLARLRDAEKVYRAASEPFAVDPALNVLLQLLAPAGEKR